jgi:hypothetical protein
MDQVRGLKRDCHLKRNRRGGSYEKAIEQARTRRDQLTGAVTNRSAERIVWCVRRGMD